MGLSLNGRAIARVRGADFARADSDPGLGDEPMDESLRAARLARCDRDCGGRGLALRLPWAGERLAWPQRNPVPDSLFQRIDAGDEVAVRVCLGVHRGRVWALAGRSSGFRADAERTPVLFLPPPRAS